jgi:hypothetical protein
MSEIVRDWSEEQPKTFTGWMWRLWEAPGTCPPLPPNLDLEELQRNDWIKRDGSGWRITEHARVALDLPKRK